LLQAPLMVSLDIGTLLQEKCCTKLLRTQKTTFTAWISIKKELYSRLAAVTYQLRSTMRRQSHSHSKWKNFQSNLDIQIEFFASSLTKSTIIRLSLVVGTIQFKFMTSGIEDQSPQFTDPTFAATVLKSEVMGILWWQGVTEWKTRSRSGISGWTDARELFHGKVQEIKKTLFMKNLKKIVRMMTKNQIEASLFQTILVYSVLAKMTTNLVRQPQPTWIPNYQRLHTNRLSHRTI